MKMRILVSNDDGIDAPGLRTLVKVLGEEHEVYVAAPDGERSSFSHSVTYWRLDNKAREREVEGAVKAWAINATPADCVYYGIETLLEEKPDLVVSGINKGENLSSDCIYSGTVGAAMEGMMMGVPAMAVSYCSYKDEQFETSARVALALIPYLMKEENRKAFVLNVNVPAISKEEIKGIRATKLDGYKIYHKKIERIPCEDGSFILHCPNQPGLAAGLGDSLDGDITAVRNGYVSVTPLYEDMADHRQLGMMENWNSISLNVK